MKVWSCPSCGYSGEDGYDAGEFMTEQYILPRYDTVVIRKLLIKCNCCGATNDISNKRYVYSTKTIETTEVGSQWRTYRPGKIKIEVSA